MSFEYGGSSFHAFDDAARALAVDVCGPDARALAHLDPRSCVDLASAWVDTWIAQGGDLLFAIREKVPGASIAVGIDRGRLIEFVGDRILRLRGVG